MAYGTEMESLMNKYQSTDVPIGMYLQDYKANSVSSMMSGYYAVVGGR